VKSTSIRALVYGDANLNVIDGSSVWVQGAVQALAAAGCDVTLLVKAPVLSDKLLAPLLTTKGVTVRKPFEEKLVGKAVRQTREMTPVQATAVMHKLDREQRFDIILVRGLSLVGSLVADGSFTNRLWTYLTDIPQAIATMTPEIHEDLAKIVVASRFLLCQTEELRSLLETLVPESCGRTALLPPIVPEPDFELPERDTSAPVAGKLVYMGKYAPDWNTLEMTALPAMLAERGQPVEVHMVGDKIHRAPDDPGFAWNMRQALSETPGVVWHGGVSRQQAWRIAATCDVGLSWRDESLDESLELSTKLLEYGRLGLPVVLNRTPMHEVLLGSDYPLFVDGDNIADVIVTATTNKAARQVAAERCSAAARPHSLKEVAERMRSLIATAFPSVPELASRRRPLRVLVASHDFKFFTRIQDYLASLPGIDLRVDVWEALDKHDERQSARLNAWADVVICEWCGPNAAWYSKHKRPGQRLIVRLHRFELFGRYTQRVAIAAIDQVVCVSPHYAALTRERTGWPATKVVTIANWVDFGQLDRLKLAKSEYTLGFIGIAPIERKRFDRALDILADLRRRDRRFQMIVKTKMPWDYPWIWAKPEERELTTAALQRIRHEPDLRNSVTFDSFGADIGNYLRRVGFVLSTSDDESFHLAPAEGMASGAVPVIINWPGADTTYSSRWIYDSTSKMADAIYDSVVSGDWQKLGIQAQDEARTDFGLDVVCAQWAKILTENLPSSTPSRGGAEAPAAGGADVAKAAN
jgi:glycosyltransferase involved in cell wall biosynthesis